MDHRIESAEIRAVNVMHVVGDECTEVATFLHHSLTPERQKELTLLLEGLIVNAVKVFVS